MFTKKLSQISIFLSKITRFDSTATSVPGLIFCRSCSTIQQKTLNVEQSDGSRKLVEGYRNVMSRVPNPVIVVTAAIGNESGQWLKRGVTCSSLTSVSLEPPVISFTMSKPSRMHQLLLETQQFAVHVLGKDQVNYGVHFSRPSLDGKDQFINVPHQINHEGIPIIKDTSAVLSCKAHSVHSVGDHHVWYGEVTSCTADDQPDPLLYFSRSYRTVGDELLIKAFEDKTLPFEEWDHAAHLQMAWNYIKAFGVEKATPMIKNGIKEYNEKNKDLIQRGYHETVTMFFITVLHSAIKNLPDPDITFEEFIESNPHLSDKHFMLKFYSPEVLESKEAVKNFLPPDRQELPS